MKIYNGFGIVPTKNYEAAGYDFYVPNIVESDEAQVAAFMNGITKSYGNLDYEQILRDIYAWTKMAAGVNSENAKNNTHNILHFYLAVNHTNRNLDVADFCNKYLIFDDFGNVGVNLHVHDTIFINSGIKEAIPHGYAGIFLNKSGRGLKGFDVRAQVVDEDYTGYVHLSQQYSNANENDGKFFAGDKIVQQCIIPVLNETVDSVSEDDYINEMANSNRGDKGFGSSDENHDAETTKADPDAKPTESKKPGRKPTKK